MSANPRVSEFRVEKIRSHATITLISGETVLGCFFVSGSSAHWPGRERVGELLNAGRGFFPFEVQDGGTARTVLINRSQLLTATLAESETGQDAGYEVATPRMAAIQLSDGRRVVGTVRVYEPEGRDRLSDWTRHPDQFRYVDSDLGSLIVNMAHVVKVSEVEPGK